MNRKANAIKLLIGISILAVSWACANVNVPDTAIPPTTGEGGEDIYSSKERGPLERHTFSRDRRDMHATISPDGAHIYYASRYPSTLEDIFMKPLHGSLVTRITQHNGSDAYPAVSPDGKKLAFVSTRGGHADIFVLPIPRGNARPAAISPGSKTAKMHPSWSPDGKKIVFSEFNSVFKDWQLAIYDFDTNTVSYPREGLNGMYPEWSPVAGDNRIVFQHTPRGSGGIYSLWLINADGTELRRLFQSEEYSCMHPSWSPDGKFVAYNTVAKSPEKDEKWEEPDNIWVISSDATRNVQITYHSAGDWNPAFSPDGTRIYFTSDRGGHHNIWSIPFSR